MVKYSCERCGKEFSQKSHYDSHNRRKTPCENNADKIKALIDKAVEEKVEETLKELNNNLIINNQVISNKIIKNVSSIRVLDLFCGCGGMSKGLEDAGLNIVAGLDIWDKAIDSYTQNFDHLSVCEDISKLSPETFDTKYKIGKNSIDLIVGGPPCQGFSIAGK